jgi:hypothetical protein
MQEVVLIRMALEKLQKDILIQAVLIVTGYTLD